MRKLFFIAYLIMIIISGLFASCNVYNQYKTLQDYRKFVDSMDTTNEPFEVACETDFYTNNIQEDRQ